MPSYGRVQANGLIVLGRSGAVVVDSAWTPEQTAWLLDQAARASGRKAVALVTTHFHEDRAGGIEAARVAGVPVYASLATQRLLATEDVSHPFEGEAAIDLGDRRVEILYPGTGHSPDNVVVYLAEEQLLFGGCLVRAAEHDIGNLGDADVAAWPATMDRLIERYGSAAVVVPGHGNVGDASLLHHTRALALKAAR
jgi:glyoxylase-like metal-dependent hydrolase (beta-lactamase superfamily II)